MICSYIFPNPKYSCALDRDHEGPHHSSLPTLTYELCRERNSHGSTIYLFRNSDGIESRWCMVCYKPITIEESADYLRRCGGPGHWLGCKLDPNHDGDCVVPANRGH